MGMTDEADDAYATTLTRLPGLAADPSWHTGTLGSRFQGILSEALGRLGPSGWPLAMEAGDPDRARTIAAALSDPAMATLVIDAWGHDPEAVRRLLEAAGASTRDSTLHGWAAIIAEREGDEDAVDRFQRLAAFNWEGAELPGHTFVIAPDDGMRGLEGIPAGTRSAFYGEWLYRRQMPIDLTPPGLPRPVYADIDTTPDPSADAPSAGGADEGGSSD
jgi:hypothetical protein